MNKIILSCCLLFIVNNLISQKSSYDPDRVYSIEQLREDFRFFRSKLENKHPNLYQYTSKEILNLYFDSLYTSINAPMNERSFYTILTLLNAKIKDGHTMQLPGASAINYHVKNDGYFPFYVTIVSNRLFVNMNCTADSTILDGDEIISINEKQTKNILDYLLERQIHDGVNQTYPVWILTNYFKEYYSFSFGNPTTFSLIVKNSNGEEKRTTVGALSKDSIRFYRQANYTHKIPVAAKGISMDINSQTGIATVMIRSFDKEILKSTYKQQYNEVLREIFKEIEEKQVKELILDLRNNQGGDWAPGTLLLSYLIREPLKFLENSIQSKIINPKPNSYKNNLYVLINGGSFSITGIIASYLELTKRGVLIGEEAGGNKTLLSGEPVSFTLPNTKIECQSSTQKFIIRNGKDDGHGVLPEFCVVADRKSILSNSDPVMEKVLLLIKENKKKGY
ncbi:MAG: S41 family peptidase [Chitinophagaceae bacterium]